MLAHIVYVRSARSACMRTYAWHVAGLRTARKLDARAGCMVLVLAAHLVLALLPVGL